jgi:thymidylate kinase
MEEVDMSFSERVARGYQAIAAAEPQRVCVLDAVGKVAQIQAAIWETVKPLLA